MIVTTGIQKSLYINIILEIHFKALVKKGYFCFLVGPFKVKLGNIKK
jgi:hypothetical protein